MIRKILMPLLIIAGFGLMGCQEYGSVEQGRTVAFDEATKTVTILKDMSADASKPDYTGAAIKFALPDDPAETGAVPKPGLCVAIDIDKKTISMFNPASGGVDVVPFEIADQHKGVDSKHVLVFDGTANKAREFPQINAAEHSVTMYLRKQQQLVTMKLAEADFEKYKITDWVFGDEVRYYYKDIAKALRFMNITKTDIFKR